jgi:hypothetical protein
MWADVLDGDRRVPDKTWTVRRIVPVRRVLRGGDEDDRVMINRGPIEVRPGTASKVPIVLAASLRHAYPRQCRPLSMVDCCSRLPE